jgi:Tfp pilus assembly protein PilV
MTNNVFTKNNSGLTLVETLITLGFAMLLILALISLTSFNVRNSLLVTENQDAINSANKLLDDIKDIRDISFSILYTTPPYDCTKPTTLCVINTVNKTVATIPPSVLTTTTVPVSYFNTVSVSGGNPPTELNIRIITVWNIGSSRFSSAFNTIFTDWRVN